LLTAITNILSYVVVSEDFAEEQANLDAEIQLIVRRFVPIATRATFQLDVQLAERSLNKRADYAHLSPVGVVSGYSDELLAMSDSGEPIDLLHKPFSKQQMIDFTESMLKAAR